MTRRDPRVVGRRLDDLPPRRVGGVLGFRLDGVDVGDSVDVRVVAIDGGEFVLRATDRITLVRVAAVD